MERIKEIVCYMDGEPEHIAKTEEEARKWVAKRRRHGIDAEYRHETLVVTD